MERNEFLAALRERLTGLPAEEVQSALRYYEEYLDEAENEEEAIRSLGSPEQIAARILADFEQQDAAKPAAPAAAKKEEAPSKKRDPWKTAGLVLLLICASPLLLALGAVALSLAIASVSVLISVIVAVIAPFLALSLVFLALFIVLLYWSGAADRKSTRLNSSHP